MVMNLALPITAADIPKFFERCCIWEGRIVGLDHLGRSRVMLLA